MARAGDLLRLLGAGLGVRDPGQPRDQGDAAHPSDDGGARAPESLGQEGARPGDPGLLRRTRPRVRVGRRRRGRSLAAGADDAILVTAGIKTREEALAELGLGGM